MNLAKKRRLHRIRKGHDCPHCKMHFGWERQFAAHIKTCKPAPLDRESSARPTAPVSSQH